jgi:hypothetical protein
VIGHTRGLPHHRIRCERLVFSVRYALWPKSFLIGGGGAGVVCQVGREAEETIEHTHVVQQSANRWQHSDDWDKHLV